jgi:hypothetical protein
MLNLPHSFFPIVTGTVTRDADDGAFFIYNHVKIFKCFLNEILRIYMFI